MHGFNHYDGSIHHRTDGDGNSTKRHDVGVESLCMHDHESDQNSYRQRQDNHQRRTEVEQEQETNQHHDEELLDQLGLERIHRTVDQGGAVIGFNDLHTFRQAVLELSQSLFDAFDGGAGIFTKAHNNDTTDHFAFTIQFGDAASELRAQPDIGDIIEPHRCAFLIHTQWDFFKIGYGCQVTGRAHHVLGFTQLNY